MLLSVLAAAVPLQPKLLSFRASLCKPLSAAFGEALSAAFGEALLAGFLLGFPALTLLGDKHYRTDYHFRCLRNYKRCDESPTHNRTTVIEYIFRNQLPSFRVMVVDEQQGVDHGYHGDRCH